MFAISFPGIFVVVMYQVQGITIIIHYSLISYIDIYIYIYISFTMHWHIFFTKFLSESPYWCVDANLNLDNHAKMFFPF